MTDRADDMNKILALLEKSDAPYAVSTISQKEFKSKSRANLQRVEAALDTLMKSNKVKQFPPQRKNQPPRYLNIDRSVRATEQILAFVGKANRPTLAGAKHAVTRYNRVSFDKAYGILINEKKIFRLNKGRSVLLFHEPPPPREFLTGRQRTALKEIVARLTPQFGKNLTLDALLDFIDDTATKMEKPVGQITDEMLKKWYEEDLPELMGDTAMPIPYTWKRYEEWCEESGHRANLKTFHEKLIGLAEKGDIELIPHALTDPINVKRIKSCPSDRNAGKSLCIGAGQRRDKMPS